MHLVQISQFWHTGGWQGIGCKVKQYYSSNLAANQEYTKNGCIISSLNEARVPSSCGYNYCGVCIYIVFDAQC